MPNIVQYGLKNLYYAVATIDSATQAYTYGTPVKWNGSVSISLDPKGSYSNKYADDKEIYKNISNKGYTGSLAMTIVPDEVKKDIFGFVEDSASVLFEDSSAVTVPVALMFQLSGDEAATKHVIYDVLLTRPSEEAATTDEAVETKDLTLAFEVRPRLDTGYTKAKVEDGQTPYASFFDSVYEFAV